MDLEQMKKEILETGHRERIEDGVTLVSHRPAPEELLGKERLREIRRKRGPTEGHRYKVSVKGLSHHQGGLALWRSVKEGDKCELVLEPGNIADENAILVQWRGKTLGYLNAKKAKLLAPYIEGGAKFDVTVSYSQPGVIWRNGREDDNWHDISVEIDAIVAAVIDCVCLGRHPGSRGSKTHAGNTRSSNPRLHVSARRSDSTRRRYSSMEECRHCASHGDCRGQELQLWRDRSRHHLETRGEEGRDIPIFLYAPSKYAGEADRSVAAKRKPCLFATSQIFSGARPYHPG